MSKTPSKRVTMLDVAAACDVSYQTVSRVINNAPNVAPKTRERVLEVINELGYQPNKAARSLAGRHSRTLALIAYGMQYYGPAQMMIHIERVAREAGYDLIFSNADDLAEAIRSLGRWAVDGILVIAPTADSQHHYLDNGEEIPIVQLDTMPNAAVPSIIIDQFAGGRMAASHLLELGHRQIGLINGPENWYGARSRKLAWLETLKNAGVTPVVSLEGDWTVKSGYMLVKRLLESQNDVTALLVANDQMALGAMRAIIASGLRVPEDISVIGFDDTPEAAYLTPPLTTIRQDFAQMAQLGISYLIDWIADPSLKRRQEVIAPLMIERASTAPPRQP